MSDLIINNDYKTWLSELKYTIQQRQIKAAIAVNTELIKVYWELGKQIVEKQANTNWGSGFIDQLSKDLKTEFPEMNSFSSKNLRNCRQFYQFYSDSLIWKQLVSKLENQQLISELENKLFSIPWGHHILIMQKNKNQNEALFYIEKP